MSKLTDKLTLEQKQFVINEITDDVSSFYINDPAHPERTIEWFMRHCPNMSQEQAKIATSVYFSTLKDVRNKDEQTFYTFYKNHPGFNWPESFKQELEDKFVKKYWVIESTDDDGFVKYTAYDKSDFPTIADARKYFSENYTGQNYHCYHDCSKEEMKHYASKSW